MKFIKKINYVRFTIFDESLGLQILYNGEVIT